MPRFYENGRSITAYTRRKKLYSTLSEINPRHSFRTCLYKINFNVTFSHPIFERTNLWHGPILKHITSKKGFPSVRRASTLINVNLNNCGRKGPSSTCKVSFRSLQETNKSAIRPLCRGLFPHLPCGFK